MKGIDDVMIVCENYRRLIINKSSHPSNYTIDLGFASLKILAVHRRMMF